MSKWTKSATVAAVLGMLHIVRFAESAPSSLPASTSYTSYLGLQTELANVRATAAAIISNVTIRCGIPTIRSDCPPPEERGNATCERVGSGFSFVDPADNDTLSAVADAPWGSYVPIPPESLQGVTAFALQYAADQSGLNVEFYAARVPPAIMNDPDSTKLLLYMQEDQQFDCSAQAVTFQYERQEYLRYSAPYLNYGFVAVTLRPQVAPVVYTDIMWSTFTAFTPGCWGVVAVSVVVSAVVHAILNHIPEGTVSDADADNDSSEEEEEEEELAKKKKKTTAGVVGVSLYHSAVSMTAHGFFSHKTLAADLYARVKAVCYFLLMAMYAANLAAYFTLAPQLAQPISTVQDFIDLGTPACIGNHSNHIRFFNLYYPELELLIVPDWPNALDGVLSGLCLGAVGANLDLLYGMGLDSDTEGRWCGLKLTGPLLGNYQFGFGFVLNSTQLPDSVVNSINVFVAEAVDIGLLQMYSDSVFSYDRPQCALEDFLEFSQASVGWTAVSVQALSGLAIMIGASVVVAYIMHFAVQTIKPYIKSRPHRVRKEAIRNRGEGKNGGESAHVAEEGDTNGQGDGVAADDGHGVPLV